MFTQNAIFKPKILTSSKKTIKVKTNIFTNVHKQLDEDGSSSVGYKKQK